MSDAHRTGQGRLDDASRVSTLTRRLAVSCVVMLVCACGSPPRSGGYYQNDGPPDTPRRDVADTPDAVPRIETPRSANARPYTVMGRSYTPMTALRPYRERGIASWYGRQFHGQKTASGETYDMYAMSAAHKTLPLPSYARVTNVRNGRSVIVRVNDRGPFHADRVIDLSYAAAVKLAGPNVGLQEVEVELLLAEEIARIRGEGATTASRAPQATNVASSSAETPPASDTDASGPGIAVQLGAFGQRGNAEALRERLARERPDLADRIVVVMREQLFRLHVGPYADRVEALSIAAELRNALGLESVIVDRR